MPAAQVAYARSFVTLVPSHNRLQTNYLEDSFIPEITPKQLKPKKKKAEKPAAVAPKPRQERPVDNEVERFLRKDANRYAPMTHALLLRLYEHLDRLKTHLVGFPDDKIVLELLRKHEKLAKDLLVRHNQRIVISIANRYMHKGLSFADLFQEGNIGLLRAIDRFDYKRGYKFSTMAVWWIKEGIDRAVKNQARIIRVPIGRLQKKVRVQKAFGYGFTELKTELDSKQIAQMTGLTQKEVEEMSLYDYTVSSLDRKLSSEGDKTLSDVMADPNAIEPAQSVVISDNQIRLIQRLDDVLSKDDARLIKRRFGLGGQHERTDSQLADIYGVKDSEIRKRLKSILEKLQVEIDPSEFCIE